MDDSLALQPRDMYWKSVLFTIHEVLIFVLTTLVSSATGMMKYDNDAIYAFAFLTGCP